MSQENVELTYRALDAFNRRDLDASLALTDDDVEGVPRAARMEGSYRHRVRVGCRRAEPEWWCSPQARASSARRPSIVVAVVITPATALAAVIVPRLDRERRDHGRSRRGGRVRGRC
jgi:hypothetical protein